MADDAPNTRKSRAWCFTWFNYNVDLNLDDPFVVYAVWQEEICPTTLRPHLQGYVYYKHPTTLKVIKDLLDAPGAHLDIARGSPAQNRKYCTKEESRKPGTDFREIGTLPQQGKRVDLTLLQDALTRGSSPQEIATNHFDLWLRYPRIYERWNTDVILPRSQAQSTSCTVLYGSPGTGKSFWVSEFVPGGYRKPIGFWYDGYRGERAIILDDFRGHSMSHTEFKLLVDRYPLRVQIKGSFCHMAATDFYITTNYRIEEWWDKEKIGTHGVAAIARRITRVLYFFAVGKFFEFSSWKEFQDSFAPIYAKDQDLRLLDHLPPIQTIVIPE